jgi:Response regulator receiver domain
MWAGVPQRRDLRDNMSSWLKQNVDAPDVGGTKIYLFTRHEKLLPRFAQSLPANCPEWAVLGENATMRALVLDDEAYSREALRDLCEADESLNEVAVAGCGATTIKMIRAGRPDLLLLDVELSDRTGFDAFRSLNLAGRDLRSSWSATRGFARRCS